MNQPFLIPPLPQTLEPQPADLAEQALRSEAVFRGHFLQVWRDAVKLPSGETAGREYVRHPGAVVIVAALPDGRYLIEYQYRHPVGRAMLEFPAGKIDAGEPSLASAQRELREETGFVARQWALAGVMHNCIGYSDEHIDIWFARDLQFVGQALDAGEALRLYAASLDDLLQRTQRGELTDAKTLTALLWLQQAEQGAWPLQWQDLDG
ncbi:MAG: NUDIX hydrolase [Brachymonas sp.]|nr:NUDIX hydrolase [Brachymonas sp.]